MTHTTKAAQGTTFLHNGDYSGDVQIMRGHISQGAILAVPFADLRELVFDYLRGLRIERVEQATDDEFERSLQ
jgi:hypothetical protein